MGNHEPALWYRCRVTAVRRTDSGIILVENNGPGYNSIYAENLEFKPESWQGVLGSLKGIPLDRLRVVQPVRLERDARRRE